MRNVSSRLASTVAVSLVIAASASAYRLYGLGIGFFVDGQGPGTLVSPSQIRERMRIVANDANWFRIFGMGDGLDKAPRIIKREFGRHVAAGAWISKNMTTNRVEFEKLVRISLAGDVDIAVIGNEALLRNDVSPAYLISLIDEFKMRVPGVKVTTTETHDVWLGNLALIPHCDVVFANYYPFWQQVDLEAAPDQLDYDYFTLKRQVGSKPIWVSESGWPSGGYQRGSAFPSKNNAWHYFLYFVSWARARGVPYFYFAALSEKWKGYGTGETDVGPHWGIRESNGALKTGMQRVFDGETVPDMWTGLQQIGGPGTPRVWITHEPRELWDVLKGRVDHVIPAQTQLAVYIQVYGKWWIKPYAGAPSVRVRAVGSWETDIFTGGFDRYCNRITVFLLPKTYSIPVILGWASLPQELYTNALATTTYARRP